MARRGLSTQTVVDAAVTLADAEGLEKVTLVRLAAKLKVRPPSLFNHIDGLPALRRLLQLRGLREMAAAIERLGRTAVPTSSVPISGLIHIVVNSGLITKYPHRRSLTEAGLNRLRNAYPTHLVSVRSRIMNQVEPKALSCFGDVMAAIVRGLEQSQQDL